MRHRLAVTSAIAVGVAAALLPGSWCGPAAAAARGTHAVPPGLAAAIHARLGPGSINSRAVLGSTIAPEFGFALALSADGTTALVGADGANDQKGAAYVFHVSDAGLWSSTDTPAAVLTSTSSYFFGLAVALSADGTTAFVGALYPGHGAVYVFHVSAEDAWSSSSTPNAVLTASGGDLGSVGLAVSSDGTALIVGAPFRDSELGGAYIFHAASESAWASTSTPTASLTNAAETHPAGTCCGAGYAVAMSADGTTVLVSDADNPSGVRAYVFHAPSEDAWTTSSTPTAILSDANITEPSDYDVPLALSGDGTVAFLGSSGFNNATGVVDVFHTSAEAAWVSTSTPTATLTVAGGSSGDGFGTRLAVSADGTTAVVTAVGVNASRGAAYIFRVADEAAWASSSAPTATLTKSGALADDTFGSAALSADGATVLGGAPGVRSVTGAAYVFHVSAASSWSSSSTPTAALTVSALERCVVPRLKGRTVRAARSALKARSCRLGRVTRVHARRGRRGRVISQSEEPGVRLAVGTKIAVKIKK